MYRETRKGCLWGCCKRAEERPERGVVGIEHGIGWMRKVLPINTAGSRPLRSDLPGEMAYGPLHWRSSPFALGPLSRVNQTLKVVFVDEAQTSNVCRYSSQTHIATGLAQNINEPDQCWVRVHSGWSVVKGVSASKPEKWTLRFRCIDPAEENQNTWCKLVG